MQQHEKNRGGGGGGGAWVRRIYKKLCLDSPRVANLGRCHAYLGCRNMLLRDFHLPLFVTDKWVKCYCELILGLGISADRRTDIQNLDRYVSPRTFVQATQKPEQSYLFDVKRMVEV